MATKKIKKYFIVNPKGTIHECSQAHAKDRLSQVGWRSATAAEVKAYKAARIQRFDQPLATPHSSDPVGIEDEDDDGK